MWIDLNGNYITVFFRKFVVCYCVFFKKCEVIGVLLNIWQKISPKQYVSILLTIHLNAGINEVKVCSSKCRHTNRHHD